MQEENTNQLTEANQAIVTAKNAERSSACREDVIKAKDEIIKAKDGITQFAQSTADAKLEQASFYISVNVQTELSIDIVLSFA